MKKTKLFFTIATLFTFFVAHSQNMHNAKVMGIITIGQKDVAIINDLETGEVFKTVSYNQGLLITDEDIQLDFPNPESENKAKIVKANLSKIIFCFKEAYSNSCADLCIKYYGNKMVIIRYIENDFRIIYRARTHGGKTNSNVRVFKKKLNGVEKIVTTSFLLDTNITSYKLLLHKEVFAKANHLKNTLPVEKWNKLATLYENFLLKLRDVDIETFKSDKGQSTYFHFAIYNTIRRSIVNNSECNCLPLPLYFGNRTPFMCMKDFVFNVDQVLQSLNDHQEEIKKHYEDSTILIVTDYFKQQTKSEITFDEMYFSISGGTQSEFEDALNSIGCIFGSGSAAGCCGNYSGCCWYRSALCLAHDNACKLSGCKPALACGWSCIP